MGRRHRHRRRESLRTTAGDLDEKVYHFLERNDGSATFIGTKSFYRAVCGKLFESSGRDVMYPNCRACVTTILKKTGIAIGTGLAATTKFKFTKVKEQSFAPPLGELE